VALLAPQASDLLTTTGGRSCRSRRTSAFRFSPAQCLHPTRTSS
jgi:hypothetical protein